MHLHEKLEAKRAALHAEKVGSPCCMNSVVPCCVGDVTNAIC